jgi:hypothetical protein
VENKLESSDFGLSVLTLQEALLTFGVNCESELFHIKLKQRTASDTGL